MNIWQYQSEISRRLLQWSIASIGLGLLLRFGGRFWKAVGLQFITWGLIDALIALFGRIASDERIDRLPNPGIAQVKQQESRNLERLLWINAVLDVFYMLGGFLWARRDKGDGSARGNGLGVIIQGLFLLVFDSYHARNIPKEQD